MFCCRSSFCEAYKFQLIEEFFNPDSQVYLFSIVSSTINAVVCIPLDAELISIKFTKFKRITIESTGVIEYMMQVL
jgi:hypothetical protein